MNFNSCRATALRCRNTAIKRCLVMINFTTIVLIACCLQVSASSMAQTITLSVKNEPITSVFKQIEKQSGYSFWFRNAALERVRPVTVECKNAPLRQALDKVLLDQPVTYEIVDQTIVIQARPVPKAKPVAAVSRDVSGKVVDNNGQPLPGASVRVKGAEKGTLTNSEGQFLLHDVDENATLQISFIGYEVREIPAQAYQVIQLVSKNSRLDEIQVIAYGTTTKRLNTGSVGTVTGQEIARQPVSNPLAAVSGRIPGLDVTQSSGVPGSSFNLQIRGRGSIAQGSQPLILIDGIPFASGNEQINQITSAIGNSLNQSGLSAFNTINPSDIERIDVLKDADATAIYGSRGANGVILITTRRGQSGKTQVTANFNEGITHAGKTTQLLNTTQYVAMRNEAFRNAGYAPDVFSAPDLLAWDTTRYTDLKKELIGNTGRMTNAQLSLSGGGNGVQFLVGGSYYRETNVYPGQLGNTRGSVNVNLNHNSPDNRFNMTFSGGYTSANNNAPSEDLTRYAFLSPNTPTFFESSGKLKWTDNDAIYSNPYAYLVNTYAAGTNNLTSSMKLAYHLLPSLTAKVNAGYNQQYGKETFLSPTSAKSPLETQQGDAQYATTQFRTWNLEPQLEYSATVGRGTLNVLAGATFQHQQTTSSLLGLSGFISDALLESAESASTVTEKRSNASTYRYQAVFGRVSYNLDNKYLLNLTGRRDGSSRFGPGQRFANFGAIGAGWIFSQEEAVKKTVSFLSYGKLRASYGVTGNDQIGDYRYLAAWSAYPTSYQGSGTLYPVNLYNPDYAWEKNKKFEASLDLGFFKDRLLLSAAYYRNRSSSQLIDYRLPYQTGFGSILRNFPAMVENKGWELQLTAQIFNGQAFKWSVAANATIPKNTLLSFPDIQNSSYAGTYRVGQSLNALINYQSLGVDPATGTVVLKDVNGNGYQDLLGDFSVNGSLDPKVYGGFRNTFSWKGIELDVFFDYRKQTGRNYQYALYSTGQTAGTMFNQPAAVLERWQTAGQQTKVEQFLPDAPSNYLDVSQSSQVYSDQSFIRLKNLSLSYTVPKRWLSKVGAQTARVYVQGQNLATWNKDKGYDPETQDLYRLPPLRVFSLGIQVTY